MKKALIVFAREPVKGKVKTRLAKALQAPTVVRVYKAFIKDIINLSRSVPADNRFLFYAGRADFLKQFNKDFILKRQKGRGLGDRMYNAFEYCHKANYDKTVLIGTDCLTMSGSDIQKAFKALDTHDCVLGPSRDGGYYLIGLKKPKKNLFRNIKWGTSSVTKQTMKRANVSNVDIFFLKEKEDIDTINDLNKFAKSIEKKNTALYTRSVLKSALKQFNQRAKKRVKKTRNMFG